MSIKQGNKTIAGDGTVSGVLIDNSIGHIYQSVDLTVHIGTQRCSGTIFTASSKLKEKFQEFQNSGGMETFNSNPENSKGIPYVSFTDYDTILNANVDAKGNKSCGFFGYNAETGEARTPTIAEGTVLAQAVMNGRLMQWLRDAAPAIVGSTNDNDRGTHKFGTGAFSARTEKTTFAGVVVDVINAKLGYNFDASHCNEVYGRDNEDELRPKSIRYPFLIVVDSYHSTSTSIDNLIKKNTFKPFLFSSTVSNYLVNDNSYINASKFEWIDGKIYTVAYQELLKSYNDLNSVDKIDTIQDISVNYKLTSKKYKIALVDQEENITNLYNTLHSADYFILDITGKRFKLPRKNARKLLYNYKVSPTFYNIYSDRYCEQGGNMKLGTAGITLPITMEDDDYFVTSTPMTPGYTASTEDHIRTHTKTTLAITRVYNGNNNFDSGAIVKWLVEGYCDTSNLDLPFENEYYYLGNFSSSWEDNSLRESFSNLLDAYNNMLYNFSDAIQPDLDKSISIAFNNSTNWEAPENGYIFFRGNTIAADLVKPDGTTQVTEYWLSAAYSVCMNPIKKGYKIKYRSGSTTYSNVVFYPYKGF